MKTVLTIIIVLAIYLVAVLIAKEIILYDESPTAETRKRLCILIMVLICILFCQNLIFKYVQ